ncbi:hypothetical protein IFM89_034719 [Coptis chinensis]|uniref:DUF7895 domain-containing protein n=1 Tax=Coptis chinensis TaxID=261450 RepID=A0A835H7K0_9MAGN|nr:hypothetical protein IFM89_034719 [Coptis chinensis]
MELTLLLHPLSSPSLSTGNTQSSLRAHISFYCHEAIKDWKSKVHDANFPNSFSAFHLKTQVRKKSLVSSSLAETAASIVVAATVVGAAATYLVRTTKASEKSNAEQPMRDCEDCGGSGICSECRGEGFVLKRMSDEKAEKARLTASNMATRYTAGLPKKWSYCTKCSSGRSCSVCGGSGRLSL